MSIIFDGVVQIRGQHNGGQVVKGAPGPSPRWAPVIAPGTLFTLPNTPMTNRIALFALALSLPLAACGDDVDTYETDDAIEADAEQIGDDLDAAADDAAMEAEAAGDAIEAEADEAAAETEAAFDNAGEATEDAINDAASDVEEATDDDGM